MKRDLEPYQLIERSIIKKYRKELWTPFIVAVKRYELVQAGDRIAVCISGGKDSMLMAKLMQELQRHSDVPFELVFLVMDPGYNEINRQKIESNAELLHIPVTIFESNIFAVANNTDKNPCYLCARMRRGHLYSKAKELGCNKIALGHHFNDVIETTVMSMFYGSQLQAMPPKLHSTNFPGMTLIRPMYCIREDDIIKMMSQRDFVAAKFLRFLVQVAAAHAGAEVAGRLITVVGNIKDVRLKYCDGNVQQRGVALDLLAVDFIIAGVHDEVDELKRNLAVALQFLQELGHKHRILAAGDADGDLVPGLDQLVPLDGHNEGRPKLLAEFFDNAALDFLIGL